MVLYNNNLLVLIQCEHISQMPRTDLTQHRIPTYKNAIPRVAKPSLYTTEELLFQKNIIPELIEAGIIARCESPWSAKTRFPGRKNFIQDMETKGSKEGGISPRRSVGGWVARRARTKNGVVEKCCGFLAIIT